MSEPVRDLRDTIERVRKWAAEWKPTDLPYIHTPVSHRDLEQLLAVAQTTLPPAPKTKTVEVLYVEYSYRHDRQGWIPQVWAVADQAAADEHIRGIQGPRFANIRVTGPHKHVVPT